MTPLRINDMFNRRITVGSAIVFVAGYLVVLAGGVSGEYDSSGTSSFAGHELDGVSNGLCSGVSCGEKGSGVSGAMWFGPRLGKRRTSLDKHDTYDDDQMNEITDIFQSSPWTFFSLRDPKKIIVEPPGRLGREASEEFLEKLLTAENSRLNHLIDDENIIEERQLIVPPPTPSGPRLGRQTRLRIPPLRLGRRLRELLQKV